MKTRCELTENEVRKLLDKKTVKINFPNVKTKNYYVFMGIMFIGCIMITSMFLVSSWYDGYNQGYDEGYDYGYTDQSDYESLTLQNALALNIKHHLDDYIKWFGIVVGLGWIFHGVGFKLVG